MVLALLRGVLHSGRGPASISILPYCYKGGVGDGRIALEQLLRQNSSQVQSVRSDRLMVPSWASEILSRVHAQESWRRWAIIVYPYFTVRI